MWTLSLIQKVARPADIGHYDVRHGVVVNHVVCHFERPVRNLSLDLRSIPIFHRSRERFLPPVEMTEF